MQAAEGSLGDDSSLVPPPPTPHGEQTRHKFSLSIDSSEAVTPSSPSSNGNPFFSRSSLLLHELLTPESSPPTTPTASRNTSLLDFRRRRRRRRLLHLFFATLTLSLFLSSIAICIWLLIVERSFKGVLATAGTFALAAVLISSAEILQHLLAYNRPMLQKQVVRLLALVPIYAICSFLSLAFPRAAPPLVVLRECYEAVAVYSFTWFILIAAELDANLSFTTFAELLASKPKLRHLWPLNYVMEPWPMGTPFIVKVQTGVLNYVVLRPTTAIISFVLAPFGLYASGNVSPHDAYLWLACINSASQAWALYCLIMLYRATRDELPRVLFKFLSIKGLVFFSFWQSMAISLGIRLHIIQRVLPPHGRDTSADLANRIQAYLICAEMLAFSVVHAFIFSAREFATDAADRQSRSVADFFAALWDWSDLSSNLHGQVVYGASGVRESVGSAGAVVLGCALRPLQSLQRLISSRRAARARLQEADNAELLDGEEGRLASPSWETMGNTVLS